MTTHARYADGINEPRVGDVVESALDDTHWVNCIDDEFRVMAIGAGIIIQPVYKRTRAMYRVSSENFNLIRRAGGNEGNGTRPTSPPPPPPKKRT